MIRQRFASNMRLIRQKKRLTQLQLASLTAISKTAICSYEKGKTIPPLDIAWEIARVLGTTLDAMLDREEPVCKTKRVSK